MRVSFFCAPIGAFDIYYQAQDSAEPGGGSVSH